LAGFFFLSKNMLVNRNSLSPSLNSLKIPMFTLKTLHLFYWCYLEYFYFRQLRIVPVNIHRRFFNFLLRTAINQELPQYPDLAFLAFPTKQVKTGRLKSSQFAILFFSSKTLRKCFIFLIYILIDCLVHEISKNFENIAILKI